MTEWRKIEGWPYEVSNAGQVRRIGLTRCLCPNLDKSTGYLKVHMSDINGAGEATPPIHKLVATAFLGPCPQGLQVNHKDTNKQNNAASNLEYLTQLGNAQHAKANGRSPRGERNGQAKLTAQQVLEARRLHGEGWNGQQLARKYHITHGAMRDILRGKNWKHLLPHAEQAKES